MTRESSQSGQILLITLLVLSVALTVVLSLMGRVTTDTSMSAQIEESSRAFSAAEAGIEQALAGGSAPSGTVTLTDSKASYTVTQDTVGDTQTYDAGIVPKGQVSTIWLIHHDANSQPMYNEPLNILDPANSRFPPDKRIDVCWSDPAFPANAAAMDITVYYRTAGGEYRTAKAGYDPYTARPPGVAGEDNKYAPANALDCGFGIKYGVPVNFAVGLGIPADATMIFMRLRPVYADTNIWLKTSDSNFKLPGLGKEYTSCGASMPGVTRCISAVQNFPEPPSVFDYVLYANNGSIQ